MIKKRTVQASATHQAHWFDSCKGELSRLFGKNVIQGLIERLGNGMTSASNQSTSHEQHAIVSLDMIFTDWTMLGKPPSALRFELVRFARIEQPCQ